MARVVIIDKHTQRVTREKHLVIGSDNKIYYVEEGSGLIDISEFYEIKIKLGINNFNITLIDFCKKICLTDQRVKQLIKQNILKEYVDYTSEVVGIKSKFLFSKKAVNTYKIYKKNCRKKK